MTPSLPVVKPPDASGGSSHGRAQLQPGVRVDDSSSSKCLRGWCAPRWLLPSPADCELPAENVTLVRRFPWASLEPQDSREEGIQWHRGPLDAPVGSCTLKHWLEMLVLCAWPLLVEAVDFFFFLIS